MKEFKQLAGQTIIYGLGTMLPKFLNYFILTFYFTRSLFADNIQEYGKVTELYAYIAFIMIVLTYGMETTYFRYVTKEKDKEKVYSTIFTLLLITTSLFAITILLLANKIAGVLKYSGEVYFIQLVGLILSVEAITAIPFARLRIENRPKKFALLKLIQVVVNIFILLGVYNFLPDILNTNKFLLNADGLISSRFIFISNLAASIAVILFLFPEIIKYQPSKFDLKLVKPLLIYGIPLLISGLAGTINETLDRSLYKHIIPDTKKALTDLGIYGANYKIGGFILMFIQMFRYAAEPYFFNKSSEIDSRQQYASLMNIFIGIVLAMGLIILLFIDVFKLFIGSNYHAGLFVVPYIVLAYIFYGILFNLSVWYKLSNRTQYAFIIMFTGAIITIVINVFYVPVYAYKASAIAHLIAYFCMVIFSWALGRKYYPVPYNLKRIGVYFLIAAAIFFVGSTLTFNHNIIHYIINGLMVTLFVIFVGWKEGILKIVKQNEG